MNELNVLAIEKAGDAVAGEIMDLAEKLMARDPKLKRVAAVDQAIAILAGVM